ncbi:hypothetical protein GBA52_021018 [Prunus armeniaca]|nr:hypothetical protein GBA52_021018 [Prunus armeniaca]
MPERNSVTWNVMITSLAKWGELKLARSLFDQIPAPTVVSCTAIIDAYSRKNQPRDAVALFRRMVVEDHVEPTEVTLLAIFPAVSLDPNISDVLKWRPSSAGSIYHCFHLE